MDGVIVNSTSSETTINKLEEIFSVHGYPEQLVSDNGTGFTSSEFRDYTETHGIRHTLTAPYHPSSNGLAERGVQTLKLGLKKLQGPIPKRLTHFLFHYRITPHSTTGSSPAELLMNRRLRSKLSLLHPGTGQLPKHQQEKVSTSRHSPMRSFKVGEKLYARSFSSNWQYWIPVTVISKTGPYKVKDSNGQVHRRHVDQLHKCYITNPEEDIRSTDSDDWPSPWFRSPPQEPSTGIPTSGPEPVQLRRSTRPRQPADRYVPHT